MSLPFLVMFGLLALGQSENLQKEKASYEGIGVVELKEHVPAKSTWGFKPFNHLLGLPPVGTKRQPERWLVRVRINEKELWVPVAKEIFEKVASGTRVQITVKGIGYYQIDLIE